LAQIGLANLSAILQAVEAHDLACVRGGRNVFHGVSFEIASGKALALEGPNGAGKTSTLRMLAGLLSQAEGTIIFRDGDGTIVADGEERSRLVAWLGHQNGIKAQLSVAENADFFAKLFGAGGYAQIIQRVGLGELAELPAAYLSAGQMRRLALTRLVLSHRPLWLLDEPMASLDRSGRALATGLIEEHCASGGIAIVASHEPLSLASAKLVLGS